MPTLQRLAFLGLAWISFGVGVIGAFLPLLPTTCFMLLAVWAASKGSPRFAAWIREHPRFGPTITAWEAERAIPRHAKRLAAAMLALSMLVLGLTVSLWWLKLTLIAGLALVAAWILSRPEPIAAR
ncbi:Inner membrane protein YbaN [Halomonas sp. THAF5a]|uniref:YbaN family protein n=1 Tax=Halomonas sp. THAF5a TaxID=2587844 RepID=UPI0012687567|nr:YbaN family protein [Halomonas sp. THAF5a]QFU02529.1 Inner membrane protein YbaN [Halomonas sp. THAF5a]